MHAADAASDRPSGRRIARARANPSPAGAWKASRATITCPANGTSASAPSPRSPGTRAVPASAVTRRITGVSVFCASLPLLEAVVTARQVAAASAESPTKPTSVTAVPSHRPGTSEREPEGRKRRETAAVSAIDRQLAARVASVTA